MNIHIKLSEIYYEQKRTKFERLAISYFNRFKTISISFIKAVRNEIKGVRAKPIKDVKIEPIKNDLKGFNEWAKEFGVSSNVPLKVYISKQQIAERFNVPIDLLEIN
jgi:hypothetical protein